MGQDLCDIGRDGFTDISLLNYCVLSSEEHCAGRLVEVRFVSWETVEVDVQDGQTRRGGQQLKKNQVHCPNTRDLTWKKPIVTFFSSLNLKHDGLRKLGKTQLCFLTQRLVAIRHRYTIFWRPSKISKLSISSYKDVNKGTRLTKLTNYGRVRLIIVISPVSHVS